MTTRELKSTKMEAKESFADFVKRWRAKAALMTERPSERDQLLIISRNLQPDYVRHLVPIQASANFETFFESGLAIEDALWSEILSMGEYSNPPKSKSRAYSENTNALFGEELTPMRQLAALMPLPPILPTTSLMSIKSIGDLLGGPIRPIQYGPTSTRRDPIFIMTGPNFSQSFENRFRALMSAQPELEPEVDMQAVGWAIADNDDYATPRIQELYQLELEGFPLHPDYVPVLVDKVWDEGWLAGHNQAMIDPLDGISLYMLFQQPEPLVPEEEYY
ncbi:hypothetical protein RHMOL_Rhmol10G0172800 [Rhododendron molle]|uniref:Uncharacterized protein n=1 Tax=Rhododendron molle TaxID=49168 RepID=A0ACC0M3K3_RHOML|nr:hypothetical protein RHMOL_Rhmol10G0172800 [Rhododendron molle]